MSCLDSTIRVVDLQDGKLVTELSGSHKSSKYHSQLKFTEDNLRLVQASEDSNLVVYDVEGSIV